MDPGSGCVTMISSIISHESYRILESNHTESYIHVAYHIKSKKYTTGLQEKLSSKLFDIRNKKTINLKMINYYINCMISYQSQYHNESCSIIHRVLESPSQIVIMIHRLKAMVTRQTRSDSFI